MTDEPMVGGKRRIDRVLDPAFVKDVGSLDMDELRRRRDLSKAELEYLSFFRRLLQGRRDLLRDERERREGGGRPGSVVERVTAVLADAPRGPSRGDAVVVALPEEEALRARRRVERLASDARLSDLEALSDHDLADTLERIESEERAISETRSGVISVHDALQEEVKRRYRAELRDLRG